MRVRLMVSSPQHARAQYAGIRRPRIMCSATVRVFALGVALLTLPNMGLGQSTLEVWLITVATGDVATVAAALAAGADPNARDDEGRSALALAAAYNPDPAVVRRLIEAGADPNAPADTSDGLSALMVAAARTPNIAVIRTLLDAGADPNHTASDGGTALLRAATWSARAPLPDYFFDTLTVDLASAEGGTLHLVTSIDPSTPATEIEMYLPDLGFAFSTTVLTIHPNGAAIDILRAPPFPPALEGAILRVSRSTLAAATSDTNALNIARILIEAGANAQATNDGGESALHRAAWIGDLLLTTYLIEQGADPNASDTGGNTPLMRATVVGDSSVVLHLLRSGANPTARTNNGNTALHSANDPATIQALIGYGAHVNARTTTGYTPLHYVAMGPTTPDVIQALLDAGADLEAQTRDHTTPLMNAVRYATPDVIATLLDAGADPRAPRDSATSTMELARRNPHLYDPTSRQPKHDVYWRLNDAQYD